MPSIVQLKRSALSGKVPGTGSLDLGELAVNTYDGKIYFKKSGSIQSIESVVTTNSTITGSIRLEGTGSFGSLKVNDTLTVNHGISVISGSLGITSDLTVLGAVNAKQFNISVISSSILFESGSSKFGNSLDDTHNFTGSVNITGSFLLNGQVVGGATTSGSFTGSFTGDGSGLRGVVSDDLPIDGWDYNSNSSASISEFNNESRKYLIDFQWDSEVGTPIGFKTFISNVTGSSQIVPTEAGIKFIVGNQQVALVGPNGIESVPPAGTVSGSSQISSLGFYSSGSNLNVNDITASGNIRLGSDSNDVLTLNSTISSSLIPTISGAFDLGSPTKVWRDLYISSASIKMYDGSGVLVSTITATSLNQNTASILSINSTTASLNTSITNLNSFSSSQNTKAATLATLTGSYDTRLTQIGTITGSLILSASNDIISISNLNSFSSSENTKAVTLATLTGSYDTRWSTLGSLSGSFARTNSTNIFSGNQTITGSLFITSNLIVQGSSSIQNISSSTLNIGTNIITVAVNQPSVRFGGISVIDSGSSGGSGSFLYDSIQDEFIFVHRGNGTNITSSHFVLGPETYDNLGNETYLTNNRLPKGTGKEHLVDSTISDDGTTVNITSALTVTGNITGPIRATNGVVSGSSQITYASISSIPSGIVSGSSQVIGILSSLNTYTGSNDTTNTTQNSRLDQLSTASGSAITRLSTLEVETANLETFTSSINTTIKTRLNAETVVSGSSQITLSSTTGYGSVLNQAVLTSSSPTFAGITINGKATATSAGVDGTFADAFVSQYSSNNSETNAIQTSVSSVATSSGFRFQVSNGGGSSARTTVADFVRSTQTFYGNVLPAANGTQDLGSTSQRWSTVYTSDLSLNNGIGDWTIVEGEDDLFLYNNKKGKVYKFALTEVDPNMATPKKS